MSLKRRIQTPLHKKARRGFRGYPVATVAYYGPDDTRATKVAVGIIPRKGGEVTAMERWFSETADVRWEPTIHEQITEFIRSQGAHTVVLPDRIIGCPHEEGVDYPEGAACPRCPFWAHRDRWTGETIH
jgi:hypothetical protein